MSAPTLWEEGRLTVSRVARLAVLAGTLALALDVAVNGELTALFDVAFVAICLAAVLAVRPRDFAAMALLPPLLLAGLVGLVAAIDTSWVARTDDGWVQALISGITHRATGLAVGYALVLLVLLVRMRVVARRAQAKRSGSPAPTRTISG
ncbi:DUF6542 domain-containing protein [Nocardioides aequoreus]|uniref:DUF6542 domain-containing protein n=1 Tax=Nocardioides aequoreus TaxID=397278 RepID=UPI000690CE1E|nr:DUF6542 domain-containing protein [Nocardioides aequoreus]